MSIYAEALEQQLAMLRFLTTTPARALLALQGGGRPALAALHRATLAEAEPFYWAPAICDVLRSVAPPMPDWVLAPEALPVPVAWWWFARPFPLVGEGGVAEPLVALAYTARATPDTVQVLAYLGVAERQAGVPGPVVPWPFDARRSEVLAHVVAADLAAHPGGAPDAARWTAERVDALLRLLAAGLVFLQQEILVAAPEAIEERAARRRIAREAERLAVARPPRVQVVRLRRAHPARGGSGTVDWSCQWLVRGHWRRQWCPAHRRHLPRYIAPYIKGPADRPLKPPGARIWAVVR